MSEFNRSDDDIHTIRFNILNEKIDKSEKRIESLESNKENMVKLTTLLELQIQSNKEQDGFLKQQSEALIKINENLTNLNNVTNKLDDRIGVLEDNFNDNEVKNIEKNSIDVVDLGKKAVIFIIMAVVATILASYGITP